VIKNVEKGALEWANSQNWEKGALEWAIRKMGERCIRSAKKAKCISARMLRALNTVIDGPSMMAELKKLFHSLSRKKAHSKLNVVSIINHIFGVGNYWGQT